MTTVTKARCSVRITLMVFVFERPCKAGACRGSHRRRNRRGPVLTIHRGLCLSPAPARPQSLDVQRSEKSGAIRPRTDRRYTRPPSVPYCGQRSKNRQDR